MLILLLCGSGIIFAIIGLNMNRSASANALTSVDEFSGVQAKNNAASGLELASRKLSIDTNWTGMDKKQLKNGTVTVLVQNTSSKYYGSPSGVLFRARLITSIGSFNNHNDTVRAVVQLPQSSIIVVPPFLKYSIASDQSISLGGNVDLTDDHNTSWNADLHTNQNFYMNGDNLIKGFVTYKGTGTSDPIKKMATNIIPNYNPDNLPNNYQLTQNMDIPVFSANDFKSKASIQYNSTTTLKGNQTLGSKSNPMIIYVNGDLNISGNFTGYGVFIVTGAVTITGNVTIDASSADLTGNNLGIYAGGDINMHAEVHAQILTDGNLTVQSNSVLYGGVTAKGVINFQGGANFYYRPPTLELTKPFWPITSSTTSATKIISYYE